MAAQPPKPKTTLIFTKLLIEHELSLLAEKEINKEIQTQSSDLRQHIRVITNLIEREEKLNIFIENLANTLQEHEVMKTNSNKSIWGDTPKAKSSIKNAALMGAIDETIDELRRILEKFQDGTNEPEFLKELREKDIMGSSTKQKNKDTKPEPFFQTRYLGGSDHQTDKVKGNEPNSQLPDFAKPAVGRRH